MNQCTKCHAEGARHDNERCLACHKEIDSRKDAGRGYHARLGAQSCAECHAEHRGLDAALYDVKGFNHALTGWKLEGSHRKQQRDCKQCHESRHLRDDDARKLASEGRTTYLGVSAACTTCHFDEHRGQEGESCEKCHTPSRFKDASLFNHSTMSDFALTGKHKSVQCQKCHETLRDDETPADAYPTPRERSYLRFVDIPHVSCVDCHEDVHHGDFGTDCTRCHSTAGWKIIVQSAEDFGFHDRTDFPLRGAHTSVACRSCHGPFPGQAARFEGLPHAHCADCHVDAHQGQIPPEADGVVACERCHAVAGFLPTLFDFTAHESTSLPLDGSHRALPCTTCHKHDDKLARKIPAVLRAQLKKQQRKSLFSDVLLRLPELRPVATPHGESLRCESCHADPHVGQFRERVAAQGCNSCHVTSSFHDEIFDHDESRFPLTGRHRGVACGQCHVQERQGSSAPFVRYQPLSLECASCHVDEHLGQLARVPETGGPPVTECQRCHSPEGFVPSTFAHDDPSQTAFVLEGRHRDVPCERCHSEVRIAGIDGEGETTARYKPVPTDCAACHQDEHEGSFNRFAP